MNFEWSPLSFGEPNRSFMHLRQKQQNDVQEALKLSSKFWEHHAKTSAAPLVIMQDLGNSLLVQTNLPRHVDHDVMFEIDNNNITFFSDPEMQDQDDELDEVTVSDAEGERISRCVKLPCDVNAVDISADMNAQGILTLLLPKLGYDSGETNASN